MSRYRSKSEHPKSIHRGFTGPIHPVADRNGQPTKITTKPGTCALCGAHLEAGDGWLVIVPRPKRPPERQAICRPTCPSAVAPSTP